MDTHFDLSPNTRLPRVWNGLWQLSSSAFGSAPAHRVRDAMRLHMGKGLNAFGADQCALAEERFGDFIGSLPADSPRPFGATSWWVFDATQVTAEKVSAALDEHRERMHMGTIDLLQFFWHDYQNRGYLNAVQFLLDQRATGRIRHLGLCNFDTKRTEEICVEFGAGSIVTNQVAFSLIDVRPLHGMNDLCDRYEFKILAYGTLCGGLLADRWLGQPEPELYSDQINPSQRKYLEVILNAWGTWQLFQQLLTLLRTIGDRHGGVSIANVATRWVLEHPFVGAIIIGSRMGRSDRTDDNARVFGFALTDADKRDIEGVLALSNSKRMIMTIGDCGAEYHK